MDELHRFLFDGLPVRGLLVRLGAGWRELIARRAAGPYPAPVRTLLGEMAAAGVLMQSNVKFDGTLLLQIQGDGPVTLAVAEVQADLRYRATATLAAPSATWPQAGGLHELVDTHGRGRCAITLDPAEPKPGRQRYQGVVPLRGADDQPLPRLADVLEHYMRQSEQLETRLVLAADDRVAAGLLIQRLPAAEADDDAFPRIAQLAATLTREELLALDADTLLRRLFWQEPVQRFAPRAPRFACRCARERVAGMLRGLGREEVDSIVAEQGAVEVTCEFCGARYRFDAIDALQLFIAAADQPPGQGAVN
jgi:molecular chaperone Hsp33